MQNIEFNLLDEPWVLVRKPDNAVEEVSLTDVLVRAQDYADLAGETPAQDAAVLRLLLAVLVTVFSRVNAAGEPQPFEGTDDALGRWEELWNLGHFPEQPVRDYLAHWHDRFWLFHPERPFWQVPEAKAGTEYKAAKLNGELSESSNKLRLFPAYAGAEKNGVSCSQAARWLLYVNGYDDTSAKPKEKGLPSVGAGWLGKIGFIQAQGETLFETLLFNLTFLKDGESLWAENKPCWELEAPRNGERTRILQPDNPAELLTLQSRRLLLQRQGDTVVGYTLLGGDFFEREGAFTEQMTIWKGTEEKKNEPLVYRPCRHDPAKQFWREFPSVFSIRDKKGRIPGVVLWLGTLQDPNDPILPKTRRIHFRITGVQYGDKDFFVNDSFSDALTFQAALLNMLSEDWRNHIADEVEKCEKAAKFVGYFAQDLAKAAGDKNESAAEQARTQFYFEIDQPFRQWLQSIDPQNGEVLAEMEKWQAKARKIALRLGQRMAEETGEAAFVGRSIKIDEGKKTEKTVLYASPKIYNNYLYQIGVIYPKHEPENVKEGGMA